MAGSDSRRRKQLEKKKKKRSQKKHQLVVKRNAGMAEQLQARTKYPVHECLVNPSISDLGMGELLISRRGTTGEMAYSLFLIDRYCLGVKDCFGRVGSGANYRRLVDSLAESGQKWAHIDPASARKLVEDVVAFAERVGLKPHSNYRAARMIFGDIDPATAKVTYEMGRDGKPYFIAGPLNSTADCNLILAKLNESCGPDGFHFTLPVHSEFSGQMLSHWDRDLPEDDEFDDDGMDVDGLLDVDEDELSDFEFSPESGQGDLFGEPSVVDGVKVKVVDPKHPDRVQV